MLKFSLGLLNIIDYLSLLLFVPVLVIDKILSVPTDLYNASIEYLCGIQAIVAILVTFIFLIISKIKKIELYDNNSLNQVFHNIIFIIKQNGKFAVILVSITLIICIIIGLTRFKDYAIGYIIVSIINSISVLYCNAVQKHI